MKETQLIGFEHLSALGHSIQTLPPDEASPFLLEASTILLLAGFPELAYQGFIKLTKGELKVSESSSLAHPIKDIIPALCYFLKIPCPEFFPGHSIALDALGDYIHRKNQEYENIFAIDRWFNLPMPSGDWSEDFLHDLTHPRADIKEEGRFKLNDFFRDLHRVLSQNYVNHQKWQEASELLKIFEDVLDAWEIDQLSYVEQDILVLGIRTYLNIGDVNKVDKFIQKWFQSAGDVTAGLTLAAYLPDVLTRMSEGALKNTVNFTQEQAQNFLDVVSQRKHTPTKQDFIPTIDDWNDLLEKWSESILRNLEEEDLDSYDDGEYANKSCLWMGATEEEVSELESRLGEDLPISYRNFLLASNGFAILNESCELYGVDRIEWFVEENRDWAECWDDGDDVDDEKYFQYGEHQNCCFLRGRYMKTALQISSAEDGYVYLLNPKIIDSRNEWEAWDFGNKHPGAFRYRSFWDMMQELYKQHLSSSLQSR